MHAPEVNIGGHAELHGRVGIEHADLGGIGARHRIGRGTDFAQLAFVNFRRIGPERDVDLLRATQFLQTIFGNADDHFPVVRAREFHDGLPGCNHLGDLDQDGGHHTGVIGDEFGIASLVPGDGKLRLRLLQPGLRHVIGILPAVKLHLADEFLLVKIGIAFKFRLALFVFRFGRRQLRLGSPRIELLVFRIQPRQYIVLLDDAADLHIACHDLSGHTKAEIGFVACAHLSRVAHIAAGAADRHADDIDQSWLRDRLRLVAASREECNQRERAQQSDWRGHANVLLLLLACAKN